MRLYFSPGACSLSPHIALREAGLTFDLDKVDFATKQTAGGKNFLDVNPKGYVPALALDDGNVLTEGPAIVQYIADQAPDKKLAPKAGTIERYRLQEWLTFIGTEVHKQFGPLFNKKMPDEGKAMARESILKRFAYLNQNLDKKAYLMGETFTVADGYLFVMLNWAKKMQIEMPASLAAYFERVGSRPSVKDAMKAEGLSS